MTIESAAQAAYLVAALLFILALAGLSKHETAKQGNNYGMAGMAVALVATIALAIDRDVSNLGLGLIGVAMVVGAAVGLWRARVVEMTGMPELIAMLHSFVGLAAVLVGWNGYLAVEGGADPAEVAILTAQGTLGIHHAEVFIGVFIGAVTFTGSIVAFGKLSGRIDSKPLMLPGKNVLNIGALVAFVALTVWFCISPQLWLLILVTVSRCCSAGTSWPASAAATCPSSSRCSTATPAGPQRRRGSCSRTTCSSSLVRSSAPPVPTCPTSCARR